MDSCDNYLLLRGPIKLARSVTTCWKCKKQTPVAEIIASDVEDFFEGESEGATGEASYVYEIADEDMPPELAAVIQPLAPQYTTLYSNTGGFTQWANGCTSCGALQGAFFMHAEPDGAFFGGPSNFSGEVVEIYVGDVKVAEASFSA